MEHIVPKLIFLGPLCSEFPSVNGTVRSQIGHLLRNLGLFCSEFLSVNGTCCSQIYNLGPFFLSSSL